MSKCSMKRSSPGVGSTQLWHLINLQLIPRPWYCSHVYSEHRLVKFIHVVLYVHNFYKIYKGLLSVGMWTKDSAKASELLQTPLSSGI
jgi:hypothetical protein